MQPGRADAAANLHALYLRAQNKTDKVDRKLKSATVNVDSVKEFPGPREAIIGPSAENTAAGYEYTPPRGSPCWNFGEPRPGRKAGLRPSRRGQGLYESGEPFDISNDWRSREADENELPSGWTGRSIFLVDCGYSRDFGTDQWRQMSAVANRRSPAGVSWADLDDSD